MVFEVFEPDLDGNVTTPEGFIGHWREMYKTTCKNEQETIKQIDLIKRMYSVIIHTKKWQITHKYKSKMK